MTEKADVKSMLTAGRIAQELDVSAGIIKKAIKELKLEPDAVKGGCSYYAAETFEKIKKEVK
jgi:hypothetical protein